MARFCRLLVVPLALVLRAKGLESPIEGYSVVDISWKIETNSGEPLILNGTVQEVYNQLIELQPEMEPKIASAIGAVNVADFGLEKIQSAGVAKRDHTDCGVPYNEARLEPVRDGINYLRGVPGKPTNGPGFAACGRVSCSWNAAIWWCNDNFFPYTLGFFNDIADTATVIVNECSVNRGLPTRPLFYVKGQRFHDDNINIIVRSDPC